MVYNAMKLFMEINPQLFDDCTHEYNEQQNSAEQREKARRSRWEEVEQRAKERKKLASLPAPAQSSSSPVADGATRPDDIDPITHDSQRRLNALKLQDESPADKERRIREHERQNSVSPSQARLI